MNNSEYFKILERFIIEQMDNGLSDDEIRKLLKTKSWSQEMVDLAFEDVHRQIKAGANTTSILQASEELAKQKKEKVIPTPFVNPIPESNWYEPTWSVKKTWMTDSDGGLPKQNPSKTKSKKERLLTVVEPKKTFVQDLPERKKTVGNYPLPTIVAAPIPQHPTPNIENTPDLKKSKAQPTVTTSKPKTEPKIATAPPTKPITTTASKKEPIKVGQNKQKKLKWPAEKKTSSSKNKMGGVWALAIALIIILGLGLFYRFFYLEENLNLAEYDQMDTPPSIILPEIPINNNEDRGGDVIINEDDYSSEVEEDIIHLDENITRATESAVQAGAVESGEVMGARTTPLGELLRGN
ncbi:MAG: hypothetical protein LBG64_01740 [Pseudomonadales bacterium]|jgi:hypothetical protein|nr:hypothetical protein [Pseudomonadales bacterium]